MLHIFNVYQNQKHDNLKKTIKIVTISDKTQEASHLVAELVAKQMKSHTIAEKLILPACREIVKVLFGEEAEKEVLKIPISDNTISRRIEHMSEDIEEQVLQQSRDSPLFALQLDESTDISGQAQLLAVKMAGSESGAVIPSTTASDWDTRESMRQRELDEARARATQMEKTMRWWSDCTANWREKWSKVRNERNKAREEAKMLKDNLDHVLKESSCIKREKQNLEQQNECLRKELEKVNLILLKHAGQWDSQLVDALENGISEPDTCCSSSSIPQPSLVSDSGIEEYVLQEAVPKHAVEMFNQTTSPIKSPIPVITTSTEIVDNLEKNLENLLESTQQDLNNLHSQLSGSDSVRSECQTCQENHIVTNKRLEDLRIQLEQLQSENEVEWSKREQLESEMMNVERINKQLKSELNDTLEKLQKQCKPESSSDIRFRLLQQDLADKNIELANLNHTLSKQKKIIVDQSTEVAHLIRRGDQYESEVKRLRNRVEELKRELATTEEDYDIASNTIKKLQRVNGDLQEQLDSLQDELKNNALLLTPKTRNLNQLSSSDESNHSYFED